jgi:hypothetical protein
MIVPAGGRLPNARARYRLLLHDGGTGGFRSFVGVIPDLDAAVAVCANQARGVGRLGLRACSTRSCTIRAWTEPQRPWPVPLPRATRQSDVAHGRRPPAAPTAAAAPALEQQSASPLASRRRRSSSRSLIARSATQQEPRVRPRPILAQRRSCQPLSAGSHPGPRSSSETPSTGRRKSSTSEDAGGRCPCAAVRSPVTGASTRLPSRCAGGKQLAASLAVNFGARRPAAPASSTSALKRAPCRCGAYPRPGPRRGARRPQSTRIVKGESAWDC